MPCVFCDMGMCVQHIVREYSYAEDLLSRRSQTQTVEPPPKPKLLFDIRNSSPRSSDLTSLTSLSRSTSLLPFVPSVDTRPFPRPLITTPEEAESAVQVAKEWRRRAEEARILAEATELIDEVAEGRLGIDRACKKDVHDLISKIGGIHPRLKGFDDLNSRLKDVASRAQAKCIQVGHRVSQLRLELAPRKSKPVSPYDVLAKARKLFVYFEPTVKEFEEMTAELLDVWIRNKPSSSGSGVQAAITFTSATKASDLAALFPIRCGNALQLANKMINHPTTGNTGFTVGGKTVYHSSVGSARAGSSKGTVFWTWGTSGTLVAMGEHATNDTDTYKITWKKAGVTVVSTVANRVKLNSTNMKLQ